MIREMKEKEIEECVLLISSSFMTVANEYGFTKENAPRFTAFATTPDRLRYHRDIEKRPMYVYVSDTGKIIGYYSLALLDEGICELNNLCVKENMYWLPIDKLDTYKAFPSFMKKYLQTEHSGIEHIITDERVNGELM